LKELFLINKTFKSLCKEHHYETYLKQSYNILTLAPTTTWQDLYNKSLQESYFDTIFGCGLQTQSIKIKCIKAVHQSKNVVYFLRFNGSLNVYNRIFSIQCLVDTNVIDIELKTYIKKGEWIYLHHVDHSQYSMTAGRRLPRGGFSKIKLDVRLENDETFCSVDRYEEFLFASTQRREYCYNLRTKELCVNKTF
jgi:hypothetical protein